MARGLVAETLHQLRYFYRGTGVAGVAVQIARKLLAPIYRREVQYLLLGGIEGQDETGPVSEDRDSSGTECIVLESPEALRAVERAIPSSFRSSVEELRDCLQQGCVVFLACRPKDTGAGKDVVGYNISQRGVFLVFGRTRRISPEFLFGRYTEVLPAHRGRKVQEALLRVRMAYCRAHGLKKRCGTVGVENRPSIISTRQSYTIAGTIERVSVLGGLFTWGTPWERIEEVLYREETAGRRGRCPGPC